MKNSFDASDAYSMEFAVLSRDAHISAHREKHLLAAGNDSGANVALGSDKEDDTVAHPNDIPLPPYPAPPQSPLRGRRR